MVSCAAFVLSLFVPLACVCCHRKAVLLDCHFLDIYIVSFVFQYSLNRCVIQCLAHGSLETPKRVNGKQCRPRSGSPLFANSLAITLGIFKFYSRTYLKLKLDSSNIKCGGVYSVYNGLDTGRMIVLRGTDTLSAEATHYCFTSLLKIGLL